MSKQQDLLLKAVARRATKRPSQFNTGTPAKTRYTRAYWKALTKISGTPRLLMHRR